MSLKVYEHRSGGRKTLKHFFLIISLFASILFLSLKCKDFGEPPLPEGSVRLSLDYASCTEVWLKLAFTDNNSPRGFALLRDGVMLTSGSLIKSDTIVIDTTVVAGRAYIYTAQRINGSTAFDSSPSLEVRTLDTTSHNFQFQSFSLGDGSGSSVLYDVEVINDTLAYACGSLYFGGSISNLAKWNGRQWDTMHIAVMLTYVASQIITDQDPLKTIYAFHANDIWVVSSAGGVSHWNGSQWTMLKIPFNQGPGSCNKLWGASSLNLYFAGNEGRIIHYAESNWIKIESGTNSNINDIWGIVNPTNQQQTIYCAVSSFFEPGDKKILRITNTNQVDSINWHTGRTLESVWTFDGRTLYACGDGVFYKNNGNWNILDPGYFTHSIRGNSNSDVFVAGDFGFATHFSGTSWHTYVELYNNGVRYASVTMKDNLVVLVGDWNDKAIVTIGRR